MSEHQEVMRELKTLRAELHDLRRMHDVTLAMTLAHIAGLGEQALNKPETQAFIREWKRTQS